MSRGTQIRTDNLLQAIFMNPRTETVENSMKVFRLKIGFCHEKSNRQMDHMGKTFCEKIFAKTSESFLAHEEIEVDD